MANYRNDFADVNLETGAICRNFMNHTIGSGDALGDRFGVRVFRNGEPVSLGGTVAGYFVRNTTGETVVISSGVVSGNEAYVTLPAACYAVEGSFTLAIKVTSGSETVTMRIIDGVVSRTNTSVTVDPGTLVPSIETLISAINSAVGQIPVNYNASFAPAYSESSTYAVGDYVVYDGYLWRCTTAITETETWTAAHWKKVALASDVSDLKSALGDVADTTGISFVVFEYGKQITTSGSTVDVTNKITNANAKCAVVECSPGDVFLLSIVGGAGARAWCVTDASYNSVSKAGENFSANDYRLVIPATGKYLVLNSLNAGLSLNCFKGEYITTRVTNNKNEIDAINNELDIDNLTRAERINIYSSSKKYITFVEYKKKVFNASGTSLVSASLDYAHSVSFDLADYSHNIDIHLSSAFAYCKYRTIVMNGDTVVAVGDLSVLDGDVFSIPASTISTWVVAGYTKVYVSFLNYSNTDRTTTSDLSDLAFAEVYYVVNDDEPGEADATDYLRVLRVAELPMNKNYDLFVFAGQSNMMGASAIPPEDPAETYYAYEYKYNPKYKGGATGQFVESKHPAGEWSYKDKETAWASGNIDAQGRSKTTDYSTNTWFIQAMANRWNGGVASFSAYSESTAQIGQSIAPLFAREYASYGVPCVYAHMAKGGVSIDYYLDSDVKAFFEEKFDSMLEDFPVLFEGATINSKNFVWLQGESDSSMTKAQYKGKLETVWTWAQSLGFENFFCIRVGYFGSTNITNIMAAQEEFCEENDHCYMITRAESFMNYPGLNTASFYVAPLDAKYELCRDSYLGYENNHINEKGAKVVSVPAAKNVYRILHEGKEPELEAENVRALI